MKLESKAAMIFHKHDAISSHSIVNHEIIPPKEKKWLIPKDMCASERACTNPKHVFPPARGILSFIFISFLPFFSFFAVKEPREGRHRLNLHLLHTVRNTISQKEKKQTRKTVKNKQYLIYFLEDYFLSSSLNVLWHAFLMIQWVVDRFQWRIKPTAKKKKRRIKNRTQNSTAV